MAGSLYIHIPFCSTKCPYCAFSSYVDQDHLFESYTEAVKKELLSQAAQHGVPQPVNTVFFGGGTPTVMPVEFLIELLMSCERIFGFSSQPEISLEANPGTIDQQQLCRLVNAGFNRISLGVQSFVDKELEFLGRSHEVADSVAAISMAREAGFENINLDLIYGLPQQKVEDWQRTLNAALEKSPQHLSLYQLSIDESSEFYNQHKRKKLQLSDDAEVLKMDDLNSLACRRANMEQYEISNFSIPGYSCRHNLNYWNNNPYYGAGAGAVSFLSGVREKRILMPNDYCNGIERGENIIIESEELPLEDSFKETMMLGLRMTKGVERARLQAIYGMDPVSYYGELMTTLVKQQLLQLDKGYVALTTKGRRFANQVMAQLL